MSENKTLTTVQQEEIRKIALLAVKGRSDLNYETCYSITLLYYLAQYTEFKIENLPPLFQSAVRLLYKNPASSYVHYRSDIMYSKNAYAKAIKEAEIKMMGGDDPRCPW